MVIITLAFSPLNMDLNRTDVSIVYVVTIMANVFIIVIVTKEQCLHKAMYIFIGGLSFLEIWYPSVTVPRLLWALLTKCESISLAGCMTQFYFHFTFGATENFLLVVMAYDRYVAICNPLQYVVIMSPKTCYKLLLGSWVLGFLMVIVPCSQISNLPFCGRNIDHYYCDFAPLLKLSCSDTSNIKKLVFVTACFVILGCLLLIIASYVCIIRTAIHFPSSFGKSKAFSTCASHLIVVSLFYGTTIFMFLRPNSEDFLHLNKVISIVPSVITPLLNPVIYTLRNQEVKVAVIKTLQKIKCLENERRASSGYF
ncbi:olfactory receptor 6F1-like [Spea bombifrons]|uniref:olfactory receptor 6F1-like n=1 Tax=Spea bombifrons TaxID=233779 RepID=UPI00234BEC33|nr:olfactory receptor 6F1-like [Spea bombifrons]